MRTNDPIAPEKHTPNIDPGIRPGPRGHKSRVKIAGRWVYLSADAGSDDARRMRDAHVNAWRARRTSGHRHQPEAVADLFELYLGFAQRYYIKHGKVTTSYDRAVDVLQRVVDAGYADCAPRDFGVWTLRDFLRWCVLDGRWGRGSINTARSIIIQAFRWAGEEGLCDATRWQDLQTVRTLRRGRSPGAGIDAARDGTRVTAPPPEHIEAVLAEAPPVIAAMIRVQMLAAMRPSEVCAMRSVDLAPWPGRDGLYLYSVPSGTEKMAHLDRPDRRRVIPIGPRAWSVIEPWLTEDASAHVFSPRRGEAVRLAAVRASRQTPRWGGSHDPDVRRALRGNPRELGDRYDVAAYRRRIAACCDRAGVPRWSPNQLRHAGCTRYAECADLLTAQLVLGHASSRTTERYTHARLDRAAEAVNLFG